MIQNSKKKTEQMKRQHIFHGLFAAAVLLLCCVSCKKEKEGEMVELGVKVENQNGQKVYLDNDRMVNWFGTADVTEYIKIHNGSSSSTAQVLNDVATVSGGNHYTAAYPSSSTVNSTNCTVLIPYTQTYKETNGKQDMYQMPMVAYLNASSGILMFRNACALVKVTVNNTTGGNYTIKRIKLGTKDGKILSGKYKYDFSSKPSTSNSLPNGTLVAGSGCTAADLVFETAETLTAGQEKSYLVIVAPFTTCSDLEISITGVEGSTDVKERYKDFNNVTLARSAMGKITANLGSYNVKDYTGFGVFSVSATKKVVFAKRNLAYAYGNNNINWRMIGTEPYHNIPVNTARDSNGANYDYYLAFGTSGWSGGTRCYHPWQIGHTDYNSDGSVDYTGTDFILNNNPGLDLTGVYAEADCGWHNTIQDQTVSPNVIYTAHTWRIPTIAEWHYLLFDRTTASGYRFAKVCIKDEHDLYDYGLIIFPDNWNPTTKPNLWYDDKNVNWLGLKAAGQYDNTVHHRRISRDKWHELEEDGCIFLMAHGYRGLGTFPVNAEAASASYLLYYPATSSYFRYGSYNASLQPDYSETAAGILGTSPNGCYASASHYPAASVPSTFNAADMVSYLNFKDGDVSTTNFTNRFEGRNVRLIHDLN